MAYFLSEDVWLLIFSFCPDLRDCVRAWIGFGLRQNIDTKNSLWLKNLQLYYRDRENDFESTMLRIMSPLSTYVGLDLYKQLHLTKKCTRSGCLKHFREINNHGYACQYHSGHMKPSRTLSCCRASSFKSPGCKSTWHDGFFFEMVYSKRQSVAEELISNGNKKLPQCQSTLPQILSPSVGNKSPSQYDTIGLTKFPPIQP